MISRENVTSLHTKNIWTLTHFTFESYDSLVLGRFIQIGVFCCHYLRFCCFSTLFHIRRCWNWNWNRNFISWFSQIYFLVEGKRWACYYFHCILRGVLKNIFGYRLLFCLWSLPVFTFQDISISKQLVPEIWKSSRVVTMNLSPPVAKSLKPHLIDRIEMAESIDAHLQNRGQIRGTPHTFCL